jgi:hypothetical protein
VHDGSGDYTEGFMGNGKDSQDIDRCIKDNTEICAVCGLRLVLYRVGSQNLSGHFTPLLQTLKKHRECHTLNRENVSNSRRCDAVCRHADGVHWLGS